VKKRVVKSVKTSFKAAAGTPRQQAWHNEHGTPVRRSAPFIIDWSVLSVLDDGTGPALCSAYNSATAREVLVCRADRSQQDCGDDRRLFPARANEPPEASHWETRYIHIICIL